ncbi:MAG: VOC family protein [Cloacibacterium sp.]|jgi:catechol 2,3-dioxygenase-like lactoylglutathione lyase family enzyme|uniref:VOC family protein n=1 Tax=Cloacibacterium sp. TaxID=1913682 RepID=UPI003C758C4B
MELGAFSISLKVKDIKKSVEFYEKLGFTYKGGNIDQNWIVLKNGNTVIGLFQGFIEENTLTFNPGWDQQAQNLPEFTDVREIQKKLKAKDVKLDREADEKTSGPEYIILKDPDGNPILIDQHR